MKLRLFIFLLLPISLFAQPDTSYSLNFNDIILPIGNNGILADVSVNDTIYGMNYKDKSILFSGGFYLSGYNNGKLWANGVASARRIQDYLPGSYKYSEVDNLAKVYAVLNSDPFGESWQNWKDAVKLGADFHDGNKNGIYDPIDYNKNSKWDYNEDRPDLIGNETVWCVFKDEVPSASRRYGQAPLGIEIQQSVFTTEFKNIVFIRYRIENTGILTNLLDSVYFGVFLDPDIGNYNDDLLGCDTTLNAGFAYQKGEDDIWGDSAPSILFSIIQGPSEFIPNISFNDLNGNGTFDETETPIDTAHEVNGFISGTNNIAGAINLNPSSFSPIYISNTFMDPDIVAQLRFHMLGLSRLGQRINPCDWAFGEVVNEDCNTINGLFQYSGNPIIPEGWINTSPNDVSAILNTGPFILEKNKPKDIVVAYVIGYDEANSLNSIQIAKKKLIDAKPYFDNNVFDVLEIGDTSATKPLPNYLFGLKQNYPNPFNSTTQIKYAIPYAKNPQNVSIKVYNTLGQVVETLVNKVQSDGIYSLAFSSGNLPSGIYFIKLDNVGYSNTIKMMILK